MEGSLCSYRSSCSQRNTALPQTSSGYAGLFEPSKPRLEFCHGRRCGSMAVKYSISPKSHSRSRPLRKSLLASSAPTLLASEFSSSSNSAAATSLQDGIATKQIKNPLSPSEEAASEGILPSLGEGESTVSITVIGASGDLAKKKIFPALFALFYEGCLPKHFTIFGYARSKMTDEDLRNMISGTLTCRIDQRENCEDKIDKFLKKCFYHSGQYNSEADFKQLDAKLKIHEGGRLANRLFYLSIPPNIFIDVARCASRSSSSAKGWTRVIVEKPFGRDSESSAELTTGLKQFLSEEQIYRIDHYLGKELVENLSVLRFSNLVFEPLWSRQYIRNVQFLFSEDFGTEGRGGYFDNYGIIRDIMQNHLLQMLALFAMEPPVSLDAEDIRNEKVKVLRSMRALHLEDIVVGQYKSHVRGGVKYPGYTDDKTVPSNSITPTFAAAALFIDNARWDGVPFLMKAGKALHNRRPDDVTEEVSSSHGQQTHEVGESSRPPQTEDEIFRTQQVTAVAMFTQVMQNSRFMALLQPPPPSQSIGNKKSEPAKAQPQVIHTAESMETPVHLPETMQSPNPVHNAQEQVAETPIFQAVPVQPATFQQPKAGSNGHGSDLQAMQQRGLFENMGTTLKFSSSFHPQTDGQSEEANSTVLDLLKCYVSEHKGKWEQYLPLVEYAYNNTMHSSTGKAPFEIVEGGKKVPPILHTKDKIFEADKTEIRVQFRHVPGNVYKRSFGTDLDQATNELVIRVQPDEAIYLKINNKIPGLGMRLDRSNLNLHYADRYSREIPDAYERLLLDAIEGERRLFIRSDELNAAWAIFTPLLKELESRKVAPELYPYGSRGPVGAHYLAAKYNVRWGDMNVEANV
ncbi:hypothetical protein L7F22_026333 [Adiantum nelumboides]|nr:hypothetical protein [Adiantum nelumboides]